MSSYVDLEPLNYERIPIERSWDVSTLLHNELEHTTSWFECTECDVLTSKVIKALFGVEP